MADRSPELRISIGSRFEHIDLVDVTIGDALARRGLAEDSRYFVGIAIREGIANAIKHGNRLDPAKSVEIDLIFEDDFAVIHIGDHGNGFDLERVRDPLAPEVLEDLPSNGRGILFMKNFVDEVEHRARPGGGTVVTLRKRLPETRH